MNDSKIVICVFCKAPLYRCVLIGTAFSGERVEATHFIPYNEEIPAPRDGEPMLCPFCKEHFAAPASEQGGIVLQLEDRSWWPHPPIVGKTSPYWRLIHPGD